MPFPRCWTVYTRRVANRVALRFVGHGTLADLGHVGRVSGVVRHTPVRAFRVPGSPNDMVVIGVNYGRESDWVKNLLAAGGGTMLLRGRQLELGAPRLVPLAEGARGMPRVFAAVLHHVVRTQDCVELPVLSERPTRRLGRRT